MFCHRYYRHNGCANEYGRGPLGLGIYSFVSRRLESHELDRWTTIIVGIVLTLVFVAVFSLLLLHSTHKGARSLTATNSYLVTAIK